MSGLDKKYIGDDQVDDAKVLLRNNGSLRSLASNGSSVINILRVTAADVVEVQSLFEVNSGLPLPFKPTHYATLQYIDNYVKGKTDAKDAVNVLIDSNTPLTGAAPLTGDGLTILDGWRVALTDQTTGSARGIYDYAESGGNYTLTRSADFDQVDDDSDTEVTQGAWAKVIAGTNYGGWEFQLTTANPIVIGTTSLAFAKYPSALALVAGDMIARTGNTFSVDLATLSGLESDNPGNSAGKLRVKVDTAAAEKDKSIRIDSGTNALVAPMPRKKDITLDGTMVTNGYVDLDYIANFKSVEMFIENGGPQYEGVDFSVNYTGGVGGVTRVTFTGPLASGGAQELEAGEILHFTYRSF